MANVEFSATPARASAARPPLTLTLERVRQRLGLLRWLAPAGLLALVILNELGLARWVEWRLGNTASITLNILIYGSVGPLLAYLLLTLMGRWLEERETSALQSQALHRARVQVQRNHDLTDDTLQTLFATSLVLETLAESLPNASPEAAAHFHAAEQAVNYAIEQLYASQKQTKS
jgi:signal transduction histidine kinase